MNNLINSCVIISLISIKFSNVFLRYFIIFLMADQKRFSISHNIMEDIFCHLLFLHLFWKIKQKVYLLIENFVQLGGLSIGFVLVILILVDIYSQLIVLLKPDFNCWSSFALSWFDNSYYWNIKFCSNYWKCCTLIYNIIRNYNIICRPNQNKINFTFN